jgi:hypothetical protein
MNTRKDAPDFVEWMDANGGYDGVARGRGGYQPEPVKPDNSEKIITQNNSGKPDAGKPPPPPITHVPPPPPITTPPQSGPGSAEWAAKDAKLREQNEKHAAEMRAEAAADGRKLGDVRVTGFMSTSGGLVAKDDPTAIYWQSEVCRETPPFGLQWCSLNDAKGKTHTLADAEALADKLRALPLEQRTQSSEPFEAPPNLVATKVPAVQPIELPPGELDKEKMLLLLDRACHPTTTTADALACLRAFYKATHNNLPTAIWGERRPIATTITAADETESVDDLIKRSHRDIDEIIADREKMEAERWRQWTELTEDYNASEKECAALKKAKAELIDETVEKTRRIEELENRVAHLKQSVEHEQEYFWRGFF